MFHVEADTEAAYAFVSRYITVGRTEQLKGICQKKAGEVIGAVIFDDFNGQNVFMHCVGRPGRKWLTRHFLHEAFKHPFETLGAERITLWIEATNTDSRRFARHLGFTPEALLERAGKDGQDIVLYRMFRQECRYA